MISTARNAAPRWTRRVRETWSGDADALAAALRERLDGPEPVGFDRGSRALYATDASNYRQPPIGVVWPRDADDVRATIEVCREHGVPVLGRGGGTSLAGQCCNTAVVLDFSRHMNRVLAIDPAAKRARVEPGVVLDVLRAQAKPHGLTFGPDPSTHSHCTLGGMIGNNSCGVHSVTAGRTADNVHELRVLTYDGVEMTVGETAEEDLQRLQRRDDRVGEIYRGLAALRDRHADRIRQEFPRIPRRVSGYNLDELLPENGFHAGRLLVGSEGTLCTVLEATVDLVPRHPSRVILVAAFEDIYCAADRVPDVLAAGPAGLEGIDHRLTEDQRRKGMNREDLKLVPSGRGLLLIELGGDTPDEAKAKAESLRTRLEGQDDVRELRLIEDEHEQAEVWEIRESGLGATARVPGQDDTWPGWEDSSVPPERMGDYMRDLRTLLDRYGYEEASFYGHFGDGCLHTRIGFDLTSAPGIRRYRDFVNEAADLAVSYGGSLSGEHGDGQSRGELLPKMFGDDLLGAFRQLKTLFDPEGRMNPGKVCDPYPITSNLRLGADYRPWEPETGFDYPLDDHRFSRAPLRCVGVGKCRREEGGTMCPSYMVTREEKHSTRGRARLLFEMLQGELVRDGWRSAEVKESLDLCLACKGCKGECPVHVDLATYKAEFLSHYYRGRLRPLAAYGMGLIHWWARLAAHAPQLVNLLVRLPLVGRLVKRLGGIEPRRELPRFARETFRERFAKRWPREAPDGAPEVLLFVDTFNDHFHPEVAEAALDVMEAAGYRVRIHDEVLCCGRPLYDFGMLDLARRKLRQIVDSLRPAIERGVPVVVLEPSCHATFRDELVQMLPKDQDARRLSELAVTLSDLLAARDDLDLPELGGRALLHGHCHRKSVEGIDPERKLLERLGIEVEVPDTGCCGMAGSFGFERGEKYEVSIACGERVLLPAVREAADDTLIVADGFSCREQVRQETGRASLHLAEVLARAYARRGGLGRATQPRRDMRRKGVRA